MATNFKPWEYADDTKTTVRVAGEPAKNPKKMTGTRLGKVLALDSWGSPFQAWCEIMRVAEPPFDGNKYTEAGNALEPKIIAWCKENISPYVYTPEEFYGVPDAKKAKSYEFFKHPILGGMWDAVVLDGPLGTGKPLGYVEAKTSSRPQDWTDGPPPKYAVQGLLYGHLDELDRVFVVVRFMEDHEYEKPELCECTDENTHAYELKCSESEIPRQVEKATVWYAKHIEGNVSPPFDEKRDKDYLAIMRKTEVKSDDLEALAKKAILIEAKIESIREKNGLDALEKELKALKDKAIKPRIVKMFEDVANAGKDVLAAYGWQTKRTYPEYIDKDAMAADGVLDTYLKNNKPKYTLTKAKG